MSEPTATVPTARPRPGQPQRPQLLSIGVMIWLGSEFMFFSGLFAAFFTIRSHATVWPPHGTKLDTYQALIFTFVLLAASPAIQLGLAAHRRGERAAARAWLVVTFLLGSAFIADEAVEWTTLPFRVNTNAFGSLFYIMTGVDGLHIIFGMVALILLFIRISGPKGDPGEAPVYQAVSYYWHFVNIIWIGLFCALFLLS